jgi:hypothetical protein
MSFVTTIPGSLAAAAGGLTAIGGEIAGANAGAAVPITGVLPAGLDEVSFLVAAQFGMHAAMYQAAQAAGLAVHAQTVATLFASEFGYDTTEAVSALGLL